MLSANPHSKFTLRSATHDSDSSMASNSKLKGVWQHGSVCGDICGGSAFKSFSCLWFRVVFIPEKRIGNKGGEGLHPVRQNNLVWILTRKIRFAVAHHLHVCRCPSPVLGLRAQNDPSAKPQTEFFGSHLGAIWEPFWEPFESHLGTSGGQDASGG